jgi:3'(2'), 5'-bisphosphate nucleotidase
MSEAMNLPADSQLAEALLPAAIEAGRAILAVRAKSVTVEHKADSSPVTEADRAAEAIILRYLDRLVPTAPVVAEEAVEAGRLPAVGREFFLVDPLDGTKEFVKGGDDFTVNIALVRDHVPVVGIVLAPATDTLYVGVLGKGAWIAGGIRSGERKVIAVRTPPQQIDVVASKSHRTPETDEYIARYAVGELVSAGSSLKFCLVAEGKADLYPRMGTTMQWDTAAGDAVLRAAGGTVEAVDGGALLYGPNGAEGVVAFRNPWFIAAGKVPILSV